MSLTTDTMLPALRTSDYDYYLAIGLAPAAKREGLAVLVSFARELSHIAELVTEPLMGHMRLAWWREALAELNAGEQVRAHPVIRALSQLFPPGHTAYALLNAMVDARAADLDLSLIENHAAWLDYLDQTTGNLHRVMAVHLAGEEAALHAEPALKAAAIGYALVFAARAIPRLSAKGWARYPHHAFAGEDLNPLFSAVESWLHEAESQLSVANIPKKLAPHRALRRIAKYHQYVLQRAQANPCLARSRALGVVVRVIAEGLFA